MPEPPFRLRRPEAWAKTCGTGHLCFDRNADRFDKTSLAAAHMFGGYSIDGSGGRACVQYHTEDQWYDLLDIEDVEDEWRV